MLPPMMPVTIFFKRRKGEQMGNVICRLLDHDWERVSKFKKDTSHRNKLTGVRSKLTVKVQCKRCGKKEIRALFPAFVPVVVG
jgi:hypothetical protein